MIKIGLYGASGKMGKVITSCLLNNPVAKLSVAFSDKNLELKEGEVVNDFEQFFDKCDVVIDFSLNDGTKKLLQYARTNPKPLVIGTTGLDKESMNLLEQAAITMPILYATNMSLGVAVLNKLVTIASKALSDFDIEIVEMHHKFKKDSPSGTALTLAQSAAKARELDLEKVMVTGRVGHVERAKDDIAVMSLRGGDIVGRHNVGFYNEGEYVELTHTATSRATFANGSIKAAYWLNKKEPGLYSINDCLGL